MSAGLPAWFIHHGVGDDWRLHGSIRAQLDFSFLQKARAVAAANGEDEEDELNRQKRLEGTAVTPESFVAWRVRRACLRVCLPACLGVRGRQ